MQAGSLGQMCVSCCCLMGVGWVSSKGSFRVSPCPSSDPATFPAGCDTMIQHSCGASGSLCWKVLPLAAGRHSNCWGAEMLRVNAVLNCGEKPFVSKCTEELSAPRATIPSIGVIPAPGSPALGGSVFSGAASGSLNSWSLIQAPLSVQQF